MNKKLTFALCFCNRGFMPGELIYGARDDMVKDLSSTHSIPFPCPVLWESKHQKRPERNGTEAKTKRQNSSRDYQGSYKTL